MNELDLCEVLRTIVDCLDQVVESDSRKTGSVESQRAAGLARKARLRLDAVATAALREVG